MYTPDETLYKNDQSFSTPITHEAISKSLAATSSIESLKRIQQNNEIV